MEMEKRSGMLFNLSCFPVKIQPAEHQMSTFLFPCGVAECLNGTAFGQRWEDHFPKLATSLTERSNWKLNHRRSKHINYSNIYFIHSFTIRVLRISVNSFIELGQQASSKFPCCFGQTTLCHRSGCLVKSGLTALSRAAGWVVFAIIPVAR